MVSFVSYTILFAFYVCGVYDRGSVLELGYDTVMNGKTMNDISSFTYLRSTWIVR